MTSDAYTLFSQMFAADRDMAEDVWFTRFPRYKYDAEMGAKPWWPPLSEVWYVGATCPDQDGTVATASWPDAWACVQRHFQEYQDAKKQQRTRPKRLTKGD